MGYEFHRDNHLTIKLHTHAEEALVVDLVMTVAARLLLTDMCRAQVLLFMSPDIMTTNKMLMGEILRDPQFVSEIDYSACFRQLLKEAAADDLLDLDNPREAAEGFISLLKGKTFWPVRLGAPLVGADEIEEMTESSVDLIISRYGNGAALRDGQ